MDVIKAIRERRSIRKYKSKEVSQKNIDIILQAGRWAPSSANKQPWHFIVVRDPSLREKLAYAHAHGRFMKESPAVIVVLGDPQKDRRYHLADPHNAVQNMLLAAYNLGISTCWMGVRDTDVEPAFKKILNIPDELRVICSVAVGYGDEERTSSRYPLDEIVSWETFGNKPK
jgi:nitroreductase